MEWDPPPGYRCRGCAIHWCGRYTEKVTDPDDMWRRRPRESWGYAGGAAQLAGAEGEEPRLREPRELRRTHSPHHHAQQGLSLRRPVREDARVPQRPQDLPLLAARDEEAEPVEGGAHP